MGLSCGTLSCPPVFLPFLLPSASLPYFMPPVKPANTRCNPRRLHAG